MSATVKPRYIIYDPEGDDYYLGPGEDYTDSLDEAYRYTNEELIEYFERWYPAWLPKGIRIIQTYNWEDE